MNFFIFFFSIASITIFFINTKNNLIAKTILLFSFILLFSLRDFSIGSDTYSYYDIFYQSDRLLPFEFKIEPLFLLLNYLIYLIYPNFTFFLFVFSFIFFTLWIQNIERNVFYNKDIAYLSFISFFGFLLSFNVARQSFAMAICIFSLYYLFKNKKFIFFILVVFASLIHYSAILFLVVFFIFRFSKYPLTILLSTFVSCYLFLFITVRFLSNLSIRYVGYIEIGNNITGIFLVLFIFLQYIVFYYIHLKYFILDDRYNKLFSIFSFGVGFFLALKILKFPDEGPVRLSFYFLIINIFLFPYLFRVFKSNFQLIIAKYLFYIFCCFYFFWGISSGAGGINNYFLNKNIVIF